MNQSLDINVYDINKLAQYMAQKYSQITWRDFLNELQQSQNVEPSQVNLCQAFTDQLQKFLLEK